MVAFAQHVAQAGFPSAGAGSRKDDNAAGLGTEDTLQVCQQRQCECGHVGGAVIFQRHGHGAGDTRRHIGWPGDGQRFVANHSIVPLFFVGAILAAARPVCHLK